MAEVKPELAVVVLEDRMPALTSRKRHQHWNYYFILYQNLGGARGGFDGVETISLRDLYPKRKFPIKIINIRVRKFPGRRHPCSLLWFHHYQLPEQGEIFFTVNIFGISRARVLFEVIDKHKNLY